MSDDTLPPSLPRFLHLSNEKGWVRTAFLQLSFTINESCRVYTTRLGNFIKIVEVIKIVEAVQEDKFATHREFQAYLISDRELAALQGQPEGKEF